MAREITTSHLCLPYFWGETPSTCQQKGSPHPFSMKDILGKALLLSCPLIKKFAAVIAQHFLAIVIGSKRFSGMLVEFTHILASSDFFRYPFSRTSGGAENITQIDCDALTSEKCSPSLF